MTDDQVAAVLTDWLAARLRLDAQDRVSHVEVVDVSRPDVGQSSDLLLYTLRWREGRHAREEHQVLRREPRPDGIFLDPDVVREARVLEGLAAAATVRVPRVRWVEDSGKVLDRPFFVMERIAGRVPGAKPSIHTRGWLPTLAPAERRAVWDSAMETLVSVHRTPWRATHAFLGIEGERSHLSCHLERLARWYRWAAQGRPFEIPDAALAYLRDRVGRLKLSPDVLVWGDARLGNMVFEGLSVAAALDWEVATIGPPEIDLAHWLVFDEIATTGAGVNRLDGFPDRDGTIAAYESRSGRMVGDLEYFEVLQGFFLATTLIRQSDRRVARGELSPDTRMAHANPVTSLIARHLGLAAPKISPDYLRHRSGS